VQRSLSDLLAEWREERTAALAQAIDERTAELRGDAVVPEPIHDRDFHRMWLEATKDAVQRGWAAATLRERLPGNHLTHRFDALAKRLEALVARGPDPRTSHAVASAIAADPSVLSYRRVFDAAIVALGDSGDPRSQQMLDAAALAAPVSVQPLQDAVAVYVGASARRPKPALDPSEYKARVEPTPTIDELWRQLVASPQDDTTRAVLGDALLANGDPRGELFALQLTPGNDRQRRARTAALIARFGDRWLGPLKPIASRAVFRRGGVAAVALRAGSPAWDELLADPVLATIEVLNAHATTVDDYLRLIGSPAMASLHSVEAWSWDVAAAIPTLSAPIRHVVFSFPTPGGQARFDLLARCASVCARRSSIRSCAIYISGYDTLARTGWLDHLTALTVLGFRNTATLWRRVPRAIELTMAVVLGVELLPGSFDRIVLRRDGASTIARVYGDWLLNALDPVLASIPKLARVEIAGGDQLTNRIRGELRGVEVVAIEPPDPGQLYQIT
jgi:uncharacterized protein (TIGR02996 family)